MGDALNPGGMGPVSPSGQKPTDFELSMASAIENAFWELLKQEDMNKFERDTNSQDARDRRRLLIAIAQGVVRHLVDNAAAFQITGKDSQNQPISASLTIKPGGTLLGNI